PQVLLLQAAGRASRAHYLWGLQGMLPEFLRSHQEPRLLPPDQQPLVFFSAPLPDSEFIMVQVLPQFLPPKARSISGQTVPGQETACMFILKEPRGVRVYQLP